MRRPVDAHWRKTGALNTADLVEPRSPRYAREALARLHTGTLRGQPIRVISPEDFVVMKILATRDRDLEAAAAVVRKLGSRLERDLISTWITGTLPRPWCTQISV